MFKDSQHEITPAMKVGDFLRFFPELEEQLIALSPVFVKLRNPILRRTIARVATLRQASLAGSLGLNEMINTLRMHAGQPGIMIDNEKTEKNMNRPAWLIADHVVTTLDARPILAAGDHPLDRVLRETRELKPGEIYEIITPFLPAPMIEKIGSAGFETYSETDREGMVRSYFLKR